MSRRGQKPLHQPKAFVSFGDVSGFQSVNTYDKKTAPSSSVPLYTGDDNDLASVSKKVMKKDPKTKVKAIHELGEILLSKPEYSIAEFLPFFVYCYSKLCLEDSRTVREKLNASIDAITSVEKRLLAHHMKNLIGPWWMLTGDPAPEVAERAYGSFCNAIPPKKRQQVLVHLSSAILSEAVRNLRQRPETLSDMSVATLQEAEERLERVLVSTLASVGKFVSLLSSEQNLSLTPIGGEDSEDAGNARYRDFFNDGMWAKCLSNTYPSVRKAAYQLLDTVLVHIPIVLRVSDEESSAVSSVFCAQFVRCLLEESHFPNMAHLVNSFVLVVKHLKAFVQQVSVHDGIVPAMHRLMQSHPQLTLEYLLPIAGSLPAESVALLEVELEGLQGGPAPGSGDSSRDKGLDALCDFLRSLSEYAELQSTEGLQQDSAERSAVPSGPRKRLANHKHALLRGRKVVCAVNSMRADVCVVELSTLLLLRRTQTNAASAGTLLDAVAPVSAPAPAPAPVTPRLQDVLAQLVQSIVLTIQSAAVSIRSELSMAGAAAASSKPSGHLRRALLAQARYDQHADSTDATVICEATNRSLQAVAKSLVQLQRATLLGIHLPSSAWTELFWLPLGESVLDLLVGTTGLGAAGSESSTEVDVVQGGGADDGSGKVVESALSTIAVVDAIVKAFAQTWSEKVDSGPISAPQEDMAGIGAHFIASSLVGHVRAALSMDGSKAFPLFSNLMHAVMQSQLLLSLCDRSCGLLGRTVPLSSATELLAAGWWKPMLPQLQLSSGTREKNIPVISSFFACGLADVASFLSLAGPRAEVLRACHRLATYCAEAASIEGACVICRQLNKSDELSRAAWTADSIEWVRSAGAEYLAGRSGGMLVSNSLKLQFLLLFSSNSAMGDVPAAWLEQARSSWNCSRVTIAELFLLTLLASALDAHSGGGAPLLPTVKSTTLAWAQDCNKQLHDCLTKLFFARIRTRDYKSQTPSRARAGADPLKDVVFVTSWAEVQNFLLPVLPQDEKLALHNSIATVLDASLERDADGGRDVLADDDVDGEGEGPVSPAKVCEGQRYGLAPRKWVRHFRGLIAVSAAATSPAQNTPAEHTQGQLGASSSPWKLLRADYWVGRLALLLEETPMDFSGELPTTLFALECIDLLLSDDAMMDPVAIESLRRQPVVLLWTLLVTERVRRSPTQSVSCAFVEQHVLAFIRDLPSASKLSLFSALLSRAFVPDHLSSLLPRVQELRLAVLRRLLADELPSATSKQESIMLQSPTIRRDERVALGTAGMFLRWKAETTAVPSTGDGTASSAPAGASTPISISTPIPMVRVSPVPCKLAAVHKEAGAEPYFTIAMDLTGDVNAAHELQVEWPKFVIGRQFAPGAADLVVTLVPSDDNKRMTQAVSDTPDTVLESLVRWAEETFQELYLSPSSLATSQAPLLDLYLCVLRRSSAAVALESKERRDIFEERVIAPARGAVIYLLSPACTCTDTPYAQQIGMLLLQILLSTGAGAGFGLWLPAVLHHLRRIIAEVCAVAPSPLLGTVLDTMAQLLCTVPQWELCADTAEQLLGPALAALSSSQRDLSPRVLRLLYAAWRHRSEQRAGKPEVPVISSLATWEVEGFDFALFALVEGITGIEDAIRLEACAALHYCLLRRSRRACQELFAASLMSNFSDRLQKIVCGDISPSTVGEMQSEECSLTVRLTCCKLLDAWEASRREESAAAGAMATAEQPPISTVQSEEELSMQDEELRELKQDGELLAEVVGKVYFAEMERLYRVTEADFSHVTATASSSSVSTRHLSVGEADDEDQDENVDQGGEENLAADGSSEVAESDRASESQFGGGGNCKTSGSTRHISKRNALRVMVQRDPLGAVLLWLLVLQRVDARAVQGWTVRARCVNFLKKTGMATNAMFLLVKLSGDLLRFRDVSALLQRVEAIHKVTVEVHSEGRRRQNEQGAPSSTSSIAVGTLQHLATYALFRTVCTLPAMFRTFWSDDCNRVQKTNLSKFVEDRVRNSLVSREISLIALSSAAGRWDAQEFAVRGSVVSGEITAVLTREETTVEIKVKLPPSYPLKNVDVACTSRIGVSDGRWRRWVLQIIQLLSMQDGSVVDAVLLWKANIEKELEGVEPCPICYCTLHTKTLCLPTLACPTCNNKFHQPCLHTWFRSSGKNKCVICQQPFPRS